MTIQQTQQPTDQQPTGGDPEVIADLEAKIAALTDEADRLAGARTGALSDADRLHQFAEDCMRRGLQLRDRAERWRRHLELEMGSPPDVPGEAVDEGNVQTVLFDRPAGVDPYPITRAYLTWTDPPQRRCNGCLRPIREATGEEIAAADAGRDVPDVQSECPVCGDPADRLSAS